MLPGKEKTLEIWVIDDDPFLLDDVLDLLPSCSPVGKGAPPSGSPRLVGFSDATQAQTHFEKAEQEGKLDCVLFALVDLQLPDQSGLDLLKLWKKHKPGLPIYLFTTHGTIRTAVEAMRLGADDYLEKPLAAHQLARLMEQSLEKRRMLRDLLIESPQEGTPAPPLPFVSASSKSRAIEETVHRLGLVPSNVLIQGENGTGKELVARAIHLASDRRQAPFVAINCGAIPDNLIESELFGVERGAYTGADQRRIGVFQAAHGGTLFLDEIGDISPALQVKLLRVLQERRFSPLGSRREIEVDVRIISATHRNLSEAIQQGTFRQDLYFRLNVIPVQLPPLRERLEEIPELVKHFVSKLNAKYGWVGTSREVQEVEPMVLWRLQSYPWPGNIRELENVMEHLFVFSASDSGLPNRLLQVSALPERFQTSRLSSISSESPNQFAAALDQFERAFLVEALRKNQGRINQTVAQFGIPKNTLLRKIKKYEILPHEVGN